MVHALDAAGNFPRNTYPSLRSEPGIYLFDFAVDVVGRECSVEGSRVEWVIVLQQDCLPTGLASSTLRQRRPNPVLVILLELFDDLNRVCMFLPVEAVVAGTAKQNQIFVVVSLGRRQRGVRPRAAVAGSFDMCNLADWNGGIILSFVGVDGNSAVRYSTATGGPAPEKLKRTVGVLASHPLPAL